MIAEKLNCQDSQEKGSDYCDRTLVYRASTHPDQLISNIDINPLHSSWDIFQHGARLYPDKTLLSYIDQKDGGLQRISYRELEKLSIHFGSALFELGLLPNLTYPDEEYKPAQSMRLLGVFSKNCVEWFVTEQAANAFSATLVPIYDALGNEDLKHIFQETHCPTVVGSAPCLAHLVKSLKGCKTGLKNLVVFESFYSEEIYKETFLNQSEYHIYHYRDLINKKLELPLHLGDIKDVLTICYTSGTTTKPKGVLLTHENLISCVAAAVKGPLSEYSQINIGPEDCHYSYLPLAHVFERVICNLVYFIGASIAISSGQISRIQKDMAVFQPSVLIAVPKVLANIYSKIDTEIRRQSLLARLVFCFALKLKLLKFHLFKTVHDFFLDKLIFKRISNLLGGNLRYILSGSATLDYSINKSLQVILSIPISEGYGLTETFGASFVSLPFISTTGSVGGPLPSIEFCLKSVADSEHFVTSCPPAGELLLRGPSIFPGYFLNKKSSSEAFDDEGWFHTGDIVRFDSNNSIRIIDRKKNIFKLTHGEYISAEKLECIYQKSRYINQIFIYGDSSRDCLVAIVCPENTDDLDNVEKSIYEDLTSIAAENNLKGFEKIKKIYISDKTFSIDNGLLTPTMKYKRKAIEKAYSSRISKMYDFLKKNK